MKQPFSLLLTLDSINLRRINVNKPVPVHHSQGTQFRKKHFCNHHSSLILIVNKNIFRNISQKMFGLRVIQYFVVGFGNHTTAFLFIVGLARPGDRGNSFSTLKFLKKIFQEATRNYLDKTIFWHQ